MKDAAVEATPPDESGIATAPARVIAAQLDWTAAWERVRTKAGMPGVDGVSVSRFGRIAPAALRVLEAQLGSGEYRPMPLRLATMSKKLGGTRVLLVPAVRDRVVQTAVASWLGRKWNEEFDPASFAYRPGLGVHAALRYLRELHERGGRWVLDADIRSCFDSIDHSRLFAKLSANLGVRSPVVHWLRTWIVALVWDGADVRRVVRGLPQGSPLSPLLANLYLDGFDRALRAAKVAFVRYADDFLLVAKTPFDLRDHQRVAEDALAALGLELHPEKTRTTTFDRWFRFVGAEVHGDAILLPFDKKKTKLLASFVADPMPKALLSAWRAGHVRVAGVFDAALIPTGRARAPASEKNAITSAASGSLAQASIRTLDRLRRRP